MGVQVYDSPRRDEQIRRTDWNGDRDRSLPQLLRDLSTDSVHLIRQEAQLFRAETEQKLTTVQRHAIVLGAGGLIAYIGVLALTASVILLLALAIPAWLSALLVGAAMITLGVVALVVGKNRLASEELAPKESIRSVKHDVRTVREAVR
ncbi:MAG: phage holin family protein [Myxococcota bacterium]|nr:phage holin family protein [Myxococcota bacterium]